MTDAGMPMPLVDAALACIDAGLSVIAADGEKKALHSWKEFQSRIPSREEVTREFFDARAKRLAIVCGAISGNLECLDFDDGGSAWPAWSAMIEEEIPGLPARLYMERSPSGGRHLAYRISGMAVPSTKLHAGRPGPEPGKIDTLIETRGEGAYFVCAPSPGYVTLQGSLAAITDVTAEERNIMIRLAEMLDERAKSPPPETEGPKAPAIGAGDRPGDDYNRRGDMRETLRRHGWVHVRTAGPNEQWRRPGKDKGISATVRVCDGVDVLYVFSTSTPFQAGRGYSPYQVSAILDHAGDYSAAASALRQQGYGTTLPAEPAADGVDISGILEQRKRQEEQEARFPRRCLKIGGFIGDVMNYSIAKAAVPNPIAALQGSMGSCAAFIGRRWAFHAEAETRSNCYLATLSGSSTGKNQARETNKEIVQAVVDAKCRNDHEAKRIQAMLMDDFASAQGIISALSASPSTLFQVDEMDKLIKGLADNRDRRYQDIERRLMQLYSSSTTSFIPERRARKEDTLDPIINPNLCIFGTATPGVFYDSLSMDSLRNGLIGRLIVFESKEQPKRLTMRDKESRKGLFEPKLPDSVIETAWHWLKDDWPIVKAGPVPYDKKVIDILSDSSEDITYAEIDKAVKEYGPECAEATIWGRFNENRNKLILIRSCSDNALRPHITREIAEWGIDLAEYSCRLMCEAVRHHVAESRFHRLLLKTLEAIAINGKENEGGWVYARDIYRAIHKSEKEAIDIIRALENEEKVVVESINRKGRKTFRIRLN
ncbi:MAG: bifunctional DNA primase/polymerase [Planctomycetota bacterium]|jgi:hypothetical protein|nr:bifunctional DNA primase/polymerase [Planctomycetota bacterium]